MNYSINGTRQINQHSLNYNNSHVVPSWIFLEPDPIVEYKLTREKRTGHKKFTCKQNYHGCRMKFVMNKL